MIKFRRYWNGRSPTRSSVQAHPLRQSDVLLSTTFDRQDFTRHLVERFGVARKTVDEFFDTARAMTHLGDQSMTAGELFERFFPGREDVVRLLMEPITYANGSTLEDPALTYGIVFSNFMSKGVYTFAGGTDKLIGMMDAEMRRNGVDVRIRCRAEKIHVERGRVAAVTAAGRRIGCRAVVSNGNLKGTIFDLVGQACFDPRFIDEAQAVRLNNSSTQVYMALKPDVRLDEQQCGDLLFTSTAPVFRTDLLLNRQVTSRTYSFYYPKTRPERNRSLIVSSTNARYEDWPAWAGPTTRRASGAWWRRRSTPWRNTCRVSARKSTPPIARRR